MNWVRSFSFDVLPRGRERERESSWCSVLIASSWDLEHGTEFERKPDATLKYGIGAMNEGREKLLDDDDWGVYDKKLTML